MKLIRTCAEPGCLTRLNSYQPRDRCYPHAADRPVDRWPDWTSTAACFGLDIADFDVELPTDGSMTRPVQAVKRLCLACPVRRECLDYALTSEGEFRDVIYGGLTGAERGRIAHHHDALERGEAMLQLQRVMYPLDPVREEQSHAC